MEVGRHCGSNHLLIKKHVETHCSISLEYLELQEIKTAAHLARGHVG